MVAAGAWKGWGFARTVAQWRYANTAMLVVTGDAERVQRPLPAFEYVEPSPYATVARLLADADTVIVY